MSQRIKCYPPKDYMIAFLSTRNIHIVEDKANVLHYFGIKFRELKHIVRSEKPDLVIINNPQFECDEEGLQRFNYVIDPVTCDKDIYNNQYVRTNCQKLCELYYRKLGLQRKMNIYYKKIEEKPETKAGEYKQKIFDLMLWK